MAEQIRKRYLRLCTHDQLADMIGELRDGRGWASEISPQTRYQWFASALAEKCRRNYEVPGQLEMENAS